MNSVKIIATGKYLPKHEVKSEYIEKENNLEDGYIYKRTGIETRYYSIDETLEDLAINSVKDMLRKNNNLSILDVDMIITSSTTYNSMMPSLSFEIQKYFNIKDCMCFDILAGCSGYINALDIAQKYIATSSAKNVLVVGADILSKNKYDDIKTQILFGDGAGCVYLKAIEENKKYVSNIKSFDDKYQILTCNMNHELSMNGKEVYKFATAKTIENISEILDNSNEKIEDIKFVIPHQSNIKILEKICKKTNANMYTNIKRYGNTFCASIPIALDELFEFNQLRENDKIILLGYGGGLNLGSILMEV